VNRRCLLLTLFALLLFLNIRAHAADPRPAIVCFGDSITAGYDGRYIIENEQSVGNPLGTLAFATTQTSGPNPSDAVPTGQGPFDAFAAFLLGAPTTSSLQRQSTIAFTQPRCNANAHATGQMRKSQT